MTTIKLPISIRELKTTTLVDHDIGNGLTLKVYAVPTWPCSLKNGAGKVMSLYIESKIVDAQGNVYKLQQMEDDE